MADEPDVVDVLVSDHDELQTLVSTVAAAPPDTADEDRLAVTIAELARHLVVEEDYLYPTVREITPDGAPLAEDALAGNATVERLAKRIEEASPEERGALLHSLSETVRQHIQMTEQVLFPRLRQHCPPGQLRFLAGQVMMAKRTAPTRPHPHDPRRAPWSQIVTPGIGLVDRIRDAMTGRPTKPEQL